MNYKVNASIVALLQACFRIKYLNDIITLCCYRTKATSLNAIHIKSIRFYSYSALAAKACCRKRTYASIDSRW